MMMMMVRQFKLQYIQLFIKKKKLFSFYTLFLFSTTIAYICRHSRAYNTIISTIRFIIFFSRGFLLAFFCLHFDNNSHAYFSRFKSQLKKRERERESTYMYIVHFNIL